MLAAALLGGAWAAAPAQAATIDMAIFHSERDAFNEAYKWWVDEVSKRTQKRVEIKSFYNASLGPVTEVYNSVRNGVVAAGATAPSVLSGQLPALAYIEAIGGLPGDPAVSAKTVNDLQGALEGLFRPQGAEFIWMQPSFGGGVACHSKHMKQPGDWKGVKVRAAGRWQGAQMQQLGASPTSIDPSEQYLALQNKTVDCALTVMNLGFSLKLHEPAPKVTVFDVPINAVIYLIGKDAWAKISEADRKTIKALSKEATDRSVQLLVKAQDEAIENMKKAGADVYKMNAQERAAFIAAFRPVYDKITEASGAAGKPFLDALKPYW
jgi:TRAP-type C4-dicarboxylate transport system substrate-binding protein